MDAQKVLSKQWEFQQTLTWKGELHMALSLNEELQVIIDSWEEN